VKILIFSQYFWPENFRINDIATFFSSKGNQVTVITGYPNYPNGKIFENFNKDKKKYLKYKKINIIRVPIIPRGTTRIQLFFNYISFIISGIFYAIFFKHKKYDKILFYGTSPITSAIPALILSKIKKIPICLWLLDYWPYTLKDLGIIKSRYLFAVSKFFTFLIYKSFDLILCQSKGFENHLSKKITTKISHLYSWPEKVFLEDTKRNKLQKYKKNFKVLFAGNIGKAQNLENLFKTIYLLKKNEHIKFFFIGDGSEKKKYEFLVKKKNLTNVIFLGKKKLSQVPSYYNSSDCLLLSLSDKFSFNKTIPAKLQTYLASKKPILALSSGEIENIIKKAKCGYVSKSNNVDDFQKKILKLSKINKRKLNILGNNGFIYLNKKFNRKIQLNRLLNSILRM